MARKHLDRTGQRIGSLVALRIDMERDHGRCWIFECDCGNEVSRIPSALLKNKHQACADCLRGPGSWAWTGIGGLPQSYFRTIYHGAVARSLTFEITIEEAWILFVQQDKKCALTGWEIDFRTSYAGRHEQTASLDRIDSGRGYLLDNIQWVHREVNHLKRDMPDERFLEICRAIAENRPYS